MDISYTTDEIVMVPVPRSALMRVYAALAEPAGQRAVSGVVAGGEPVQVKGQGEWTAEMVNQLEAELISHGTRTLLTLAARRAPRPVTFAEAAVAARVDENQLRGELGALTKVVKRLFNGSRTWPMSVRYGDKGEASYTMDPRVADWWLSAIPDIED
jgi:hypothetical protein